MPEVDEEDVVVVLCVPPDNQDEGLDDSLAAAETLHVLRDSPNQDQGVEMETTRCHPSKKKKNRRTDGNATLSNWR